MKCERISQKDENWNCELCDKVVKRLDIHIVPEFTFGGNEIPSWVENLKICSTCYTLRQAQGLDQ